MPDDVVIRVTGINELVAGLRSLQGKELEKALGAGLSKALRSEVVKAMKAEARAAMKDPGSHKGHPGKAGRTGPLEQKITVRKVRRRGREVIAYGVASRAWWDHLFTRPTRRHVIEAKAGRTSASGRQLRAINRLERGEYVGTTTRSLRAQSAALFYSGVFRDRVEHPGTSGSDWVARAGRRVGPRVQGAMVVHLSKHIAEASRRANRRR